MSKKQKFSLVEVEWLDSSFNGGWRSHDTYSTPETCRTVGYLTHKDKDVVNVSMNVSPEQRGETMAIPKKMVKRIRKLN
jgi:hypothetical protein